MFAHPQRALFNIPKVIGHIVQRLRTERTKLSDRDK